MTMVSARVNRQRWTLLMWLGVVTVGSNDKATTLGDYKTLSSQIQKVTPNALQMNDYSPSNQPQACPTSNSDFRAQPSPLPPTPNQELCSCMFNALSCAVDPSTDSSKYKKLFGYICDKDPKACAGIEHDASSATYGAYSMCNAEQQLSWAMNLYYFNQNKASDACDFDGAANIKDSSSNDQCQKLLSEAGNSGTGTVTSKPSVTGAGAAASDGSQSAAASTVSVPTSSSNLWPMALVLAVAMLSGATAVVL